MVAGGDLDRDTFGDLEAEAFEAHYLTCSRCQRELRVAVAVRDVGAVMAAIVGAAGLVPTLAAAEAASAETMKYYRGAFEVELKEDQTPVTVADRRAEAVKAELGRPIGSLTQLGTIRLGQRTEDRSPRIKDFVPLADLEDLERIYRVIAG